MTDALPYTRGTGIPRLLGVRNYSNKFSSKYILNCKFIHILYKRPTRYRIGESGAVPAPYHYLKIVSK